MSVNITKNVLKHMESQAAGSLFFMEDFLLYGAPDNVRQSLTRLRKRQIIKRAATGIYFIPRVDKWDGSPLQPSATDIAKAVANRSGTRIVPDGNNALNMLGLTMQVPGKVSFITDGAPRKIKTSSGITIEFKHTSDMTWFSYNSEIMLLIVMAMREIREQNLNDNDMKIIEQHLSRVSESDFEHDIKLAPIWVIKKLKRA